MAHENLLPSKSSRVTPLYVIVAFVAIAQLAIVYGATKTSGPPQYILIGFACVFPLLVAIAFFGVLWFRPWVVHAPSDYGNIDPKEFIRAQSESLAPFDQKYLLGFQAEQQRIQKIVVRNPSQVFEKEVNSIVVRVFHADLSDYPADVIVSSDDNRLSASGGVAKALLDKAGRGTQFELDTLRRTKFVQGDIPRTSGGSLMCRTIIHAVIMDRDKGLLPDRQIIQALTRRCLEYAGQAFAASIAFPIFGGGTAQQISHETSRDLSAADILRVMLVTIITWCREQGGGRLSSISICVKDLEKVEGINFPEIFENYKEIH